MKEQYSPTAIVLVVSGVPYPRDPLAVGGMYAVSVSYPES